MTLPTERVIEARAELSLRDELATMGRVWAKANGVGV